MMGYYPFGHFETKSSLLGYRCAAAISWRSGRGGDAPLDFCCARIMYPGEPGGMNMYEAMTHSKLQLLDEVDTAILVVDRASGTLRYVNHKVAADLEKPVSEIEGLNYRQVFWPEFVTVCDRAFAQCGDGQEHTVIYYWAEMAQWEHILVRSVMWDSRPAILMSITFISEIARSEYKFESMAYFDNLLKLPNGVKLEEDINELANLEAVALIYFEVVRFDEINDLYGWDNGDRLLIQVRDWLLSSETRRSQVYRGGNGFAVMGRCVTMEDAEDRAREILRRFDNPWALSAAGNPLSLYCTIKIGIVVGKYVKNEMRNLLLRTIRTSKPTERGYAVYDEAADIDARRALKEKGMLINCICDDMRGFEVNYQPIVDVKTQQWMGLEALCRWTTPDGVRVSPGKFIHIAEQLNLIDRLDSWVYRTAMKQCIELGLHERCFTLSVNFSPTQHVNAAFIGELMSMLKSVGFPASKLNLEITESAKMDFGDENLQGLRRLAGEGVSLCLDDFGTGYSNFENLVNLSATILKTEKMFLDGIEESAYGQYLLRMLTDLAHQLGMRMISEGVETFAQLKLLERLGINYAQGYYFSSPLSFDELRAQAGQFRLHEPTRPRLAV